MSERVVDVLEPIDVDEQKRHRNGIALVTLQLAADHLIEEAAIMAAGQRVRGDLLAQSILSRSQSSVGDAKLVGHVLEDKDVHAECREEVQQGVGDHQFRWDHGLHITRHRDRNPEMRRRQQRERHSGHPGAE